MTMFSDIFGIIMDCGINVTGQANNIVGGFNATKKLYFKEKMESFGHTKINDTRNTGMLPCSINFLEQCLNILTHKSRLNGIKGCNKRKNSESQSKYDSQFYKIQINNDVKHIGTKLTRRIKRFPELDACNVNTYPYGRKVVIRNYNYRDDPKLGEVAVSVRRIP